MPRASSDELRAVSSCLVEKFVDTHDHFHREVECFRIGRSRLCAGHSWEEIMLGRLIANWVYSGFLAGLLLLFLTPDLVRSWPAAIVATFLCLPSYMIHQYEEHDNDRFRLYVNQKIGRDALSPLAAFVIN